MSGIDEDASSSERERLRPHAPFLLLKVSLGDRASVSTTTCGCPLHRGGWTTLLRGLRSREKLTADGMALSDTDIVSVLEEILPARLGGQLGDYQLVEDQSENGAPRLRLLIHPRVGEVSTEEAAEVFLAAVGRGSGVERLTELLWRTPER